MAPELIKGVEPYDMSVDVWSFGIFVMELANGKPPNLENKDQKAVLMKILTTENFPIHPKWSPGLDDFVKDILNKDTATRPDVNDLL